MFSNYENNRPRKFSREPLPANFPREPRTANRTSLPLRSTPPILPTISETTKKKSDEPTANDAPDGYQRLEIPPDHTQCRGCRGRGYVQQHVYVSTRKKFDETAQEIFLATYATCGNLCASADAAGVAPGTVTRHRDLHDDFRELYNTAYDRFRAGLQAEGLRRALDGVIEPVYQQGRRVGFKRVYSDQLLTLYLKAHNPEFRDKLSIDAKVDAGVLVIPGIVTDPQKWLEKFSVKQLPEGTLPDDELPSPHPTLTAAIDDPLSTLAQKLDELTPDPDDD